MSTGNVTAGISNVNVFNSFFPRVSNRRADCPYCSGHSRLTVALDPVKGVWFCHRCQKGGSVSELARAIGVAYKPRPSGKAQQKKTEFREFLLKKMAELGNRERKLARSAEWAKAALRFYPDHEGAWEALARWEHARPWFEHFWLLASCKSGRFELYCQWRGRGRDLWK